MVVQITARDESITDGMKRYASEKAEKLKRFFNGLNKIDVILDVEGPRQKAEVVITVSHGETIAVSAQEPKMNAAIDAMIDKAERKIRDHKEKVRNHRGPDEPVPTSTPDPDDSLESYGDVIERTEFPQK